MMLCKNKKNKKIGQGKTKNDKSAIEKEIETGSWTNVGGKKAAKGLGHPWLTVLTSRWR